MEDPSNPSNAFLPRNQFPAGGEALIAESRSPRDSGWFRGRGALASDRSARSAVSDGRTKFASYAARAQINAPTEIHGAIHGDLILLGARNYPGPVNTGIGAAVRLMVRAVVGQRRRPSAAGGQRVRAGQPGEGDGVGGTL